MNNNFGKVETNLEVGGRMQLHKRRRLNLVDNGRPPRHAPAIFAPNFAFRSPVRPDLYRLWYPPMCRITESFPKHPDGIFHSTHFPHFILDILFYSSRKTDSFDVSLFLFSFIRILLVKYCTCRYSPVCFITVNLKPGTFQKRRTYQKRGHSHHGRS